MTKGVTQIEYKGGSNEVGASVQRCGPPGASSEEAPVRIRVAVFFDGTLNNRTNVELGQQGLDKGGGDSYKGALTNVAIMEKHHQGNCEYDYCFSVYVEGVGTTDEEEDSLIAAALGIGSTGIIGKVEVGVAKVMGEIGQKIAKHRTIECVHVDSFGFSRGAAAARNFVHQTLCEEESLKQKLEAIGYTVNDVKVIFVGLFDTVASFGLNHKNDTKQLHLEAIRYAEHVVQLAAADEFRKNFPLTNVSSALKGHQIFLPGAHSDIGGGYVNDVDEIDLRIMSLNRWFGGTEYDRAALSRERRWLLESGWYHEVEIEETTDWDDLKVTRRGISNHYSRIPLKMMAHHAKQKGVYFTEELLSENEIPPPLKEVEDLLFTSPASTPEHWINLTTDLMKSLRHDYLHFSAYYGSTMGCHDPSFTGDDPVRGHRKRGIHDG